MKGGYIPGKSRSRRRGRGKKLSLYERKKKTNTRKVLSGLVKKLQSIKTTSTRRSTGTRRR